VLHRAFRAAALATVALTLGTAAPATADSIASPPPAAQPGTVDPPPITVNPFIPEDRGISDCISALPKPGCGSEARGGWRQGLILLALIGGLSVIGWRIVAGVRTGRPTPPPLEQQGSPDVADSTDSNDSPSGSTTG
jgi:hypothetical protein